MRLRKIPDGIFRTVQGRLGIGDALNRGAQRNVVLELIVLQRILCFFQSDFGLGKGVFGSRPNQRVIGLQAQNPSQFVLGLLDFELGQSFGVLQVGGGFGVQGGEHVAGRDVVAHRHIDRPNLPAELEGQISPFVEYQLAADPELAGDGVGLRSPSSSHSRGFGRVGAGATANQNCRGQNHQGQRNSDARERRWRTGGDELEFRHRHSEVWVRVRWSSDHQDTASASGLG